MKCACTLGSRTFNIFRVAGVIVHMSCLPSWKVRWDNSICVKHAVQKSKNKCVESTTNKVSVLRETVFAFCVHLLARFRVALNLIVVFSLFKLGLHVHKTTWIFQVICVYVCVSVCAWVCVCVCVCVRERRKIELTAGGKKSAHSPDVDWFVLSICRFSQVVFIPERNLTRNLFFYFQ